MFLASSTMLLLQVQYSLLVLFLKLAVLQAYLCSRRHSNVHLAKLIVISYSEGTLIFISFCFIRFSSTKRSNNKQAGGITFSQILKDRWSWHQKIDISLLQNYVGAVMNCCCCERSCCHDKLWFLGFGIRSHVVMINYDVVVMIYW